MVNFQDWLWQINIRDAVIAIIEKSGFEPVLEGDEIRAKKSGGILFNIEKRVWFSFVDGIGGDIMKYANFLLHDDCTRPQGERFRSILKFLCQFHPSGKIPIFNAEDRRKWLDVQRKIDAIAVRWKNAKRSK